LLNLIKDVKIFYPAWLEQRLVHKKWQINIPNTRPVKRLSKMHRLQTGDLNDAPRPLVGMILPQCFFGKSTKKNITTTAIATAKIAILIVCW
jgi:hypothetical protein